jgi:hypothetical protein
MLQLIDRISGQSRREQQGLKVLEQRLSAFDMEGRYGAQGSDDSRDAARLTQRQVGDDWIEVTSEQGERARPRAQDRREVVAQQRVQAIQTPHAPNAQQAAKAVNPQAEVRKSPATEKATQDKTPVSANVETSKAKAIEKVQQFVEAQDGGFCFKHSIAAYFNRPVFKGREDFLAFRNECFDELAANPEYGDMYAEKVDYGREQTNAGVVNKVLEKIRTDKTIDKTGFDANAPWSEAFGISVRRDKPKHYDPRQGHETQHAIDAQFDRFAKESASQRFILRTGSGQSGHFWFLSHDPNSKVWTVANSTAMRVEQGQSPAALLGLTNVFHEDIFVWTQVTSDPTEVQQRCQTQVIDGKRGHLSDQQPSPSAAKQSLGQQPSPSADKNPVSVGKAQSDSIATPVKHEQTPEELEEERLNLPPPKFISTASIKSGITTEGNDCFANASIQFLRACGDQILAQAWASCDRLEEAVKAEKNQARQAILQQRHADLRETVMALEKLLRATTAGNKAAESASRHILYKLTGMTEKVAGGSKYQEDPTEFMLRLLTGVNASIPISAEHFFTKQKKGYDDITRVTPHSLTLPVLDMPPHARDMQSVFDHWLAPFEDDVEVQFNNGLGNADKVVKETRLDGLPNQFMVSLKRFEAKQSPTKGADRFVKNERPLDATQAIKLTEKRGKTETFQPVAIICHYGSEIQNGHYTCYRYIANEWYEFNDARPPQSVSATKVKEETANTAYAIQYKRVAAVPHAQTT